MAKSKTLGSAIVRFLSQGLGKLKAEIGVVQSSVSNLATANERNQRRMARAAAVAAKEAAEAKRSWDTLASSYTRMGRLALGSLGAATAAAGGFARMADPRGADMLGNAFNRLGIEVGRIFVPALRAAVVWVDRAADFMRSLTDSTRATILEWSRIGAGILAGAGAFGILSGIALRTVGHIRVLSHTIGNVGRALAGVGFSPWLVGIAALGAAVAVVSSGFSGLSESAGSFVDVGRNLFTSIMASLAPVAEAFAAFGRRILPYVVSALQSVGSVLASIGQLFGAVALAVAPLVESCLYLVESILPPLSAAIAGVAAALNMVLGAVTWVVDQFGTFGVTMAATMGALLLLPMAIGRIGAGLMGLVSVAQSVIGGIRAMSAAMMAFATSPWGLAIIGIAAAVGALVAAFSSASSSVDDLTGRMARLAAMRARLAAGGRVEGREMRDFMTPEEERTFRATPVAERPALLARMRAETETRRDALPSADAAAERDARVREALTRTATLPGPGGWLGDLASAAVGATGDRVRTRTTALREAGLSDEEIRGMADTLPSLSSATIAPAEIARWLDERGATAERTRADSRVAGLRALEERGLGGDGDTFRGEARTQKADFVGILDLARKMQTAGVDTPEATRARDILTATRAVTLEVHALRSDVREVGRLGAPIVPGMGGG